ncbi:MAG: ATP-dependent helicase [Acidobacteria bacterium]|nr:ATP-dependent helicase [Acidobacteriota bacterium]MBI3657671.1 ATP-dependent helicase [Acidobacteriota bacterium]
METKHYKLKLESAIGNLAIDYAQELNAEQLAVVMAESGPMLVIAGAGSGKTRTVTYRVARLIECGIPPSNILLVTFTNKAAREMLHRVELLIRTELRQIWGGTFHHVANLLLRRHAPVIGYSNQYSILDQEDAKSLIETCVNDLKIDTKKERFPKGEVLQAIASLSVNRGVNVQQTTDERYPYFSHLSAQIAEVLSHYQRRKVKINVMDYDDLLLNWKRLLSEQENIRRLYAERFQYVLVDEYQDTNQLQADIIDRLIGEHRNLTVVGDDAQSIYSFRGANFENILQFPKRYPGAKVFHLETNYRSTPEILRLANSSINHNKRQFKKHLHAVRAPGRKPVIVPTSDGSQQAQFLVQRILELRDDGVPLSHVAVLYRAHYHSMELQLELTRRNVPFVITSGLRFFEQRHIKDVVAYLKIIVNPNDELSWKRIIKLLPKIGNVTAGKIWALVSNTTDPLKAAESDAVLNTVPKAGRESWKSFLKILQTLRAPELLNQPSEMMQLIVSGGYEAYMQTQFENYDLRLEDIHQLSNYATQFESLERFLSDLALLGNLEAEDVLTADASDEKIHLSSIHQAKGLEWDVVFVIWLTEGYFPSYRALEDPEGEEEERRLFYVSSTRAKDQLYLCYPLMSETGPYRHLIQRPSRFIKEIDEDSYEYWTIDL